MRTKHLWNLLTILMVAMLSMSLTACGDDDDDKKDDEEVSILGTWRDDWGDDPTTDFTAYTFLANGTGLCYDKGNPGESFTYTFNQQTKVAHLQYDGYTEELTMVVSSSTVVLQDEDGDIYRKVN